MRTDTDARDSLIEHIYDGIFSPTGWDDVIVEIGAYFRSDTGGVFVQTADQRLGYFRFIGMSDDDLAFYDAHIAAVNPWYQVPGLMGPGRILTDSTLEALKRDSRAFTDSVFHGEWCGKLGLRHCIGGTLLDHADNHLNLTFFRQPVLGRFNEQNEIDFGVVARHLAKAFGMRARLQTDRWLQQSSEAALERLDIGVLLLDVDLRVEYCNHKAQALLEAADVLRTHRGRLHVVGTEMERTLRDKVHSLTAHGGHALLAIPRACGAGLSIYLTADSAAAFLFPEAAVRVAMFVIDSDVRLPAVPEQLVRAWGLTPKEASFASLLLQSHSVAEVADRLAITRETGRWYCKRVMEKVGVRRQSELMLKLLRSTLWSAASQR